MAYADCWGNQIGVAAYDEHGTPAAANAGRFGYTGQAWIPELGLWYYKARVYSPTLGRFLQTDPVGYKDQINLYEYVGDDPLDGRDPSGDFIEDFGIGEAAVAVAACSANTGCRGFLRRYFRRHRWEWRIGSQAVARRSWDQLGYCRQRRSEGRDCGGHQWGDSESARGSGHRGRCRRSRSGNCRARAGASSSRVAGATLRGRRRGRYHLLCRRQGRRRPLASKVSHARSDRLRGGRRRRSHCQLGYRDRTIGQPIHRGARHLFGDRKSYPTGGALCGRQLLFGQLTAQGSFSW